MRELNLFFSWQSDVDGNHIAMRDGLQSACEKLNKAGINVKYGESLRGETGSPRIEEIVEKKIDHCHVFVADLTPISEEDGKCIPNPNVMMELGRARASIPDSYIILLAKKGEWTQKNLPFDINHHLIIPIDVTKKDEYYGIIKDTVKKAWESPMSIFDENDAVLFNDYNIQKNINSRKYIPDIFIEKNSLKERLRYFSHPFLFFKFIYEKALKLNFDGLNRFNKLWDKKEFEFDINSLSLLENPEDFESLYEQAKILCENIANKREKIDARNIRNEPYLFKCKQIEDDLKSLMARVYLLTADAGQGKTNFICDFCLNVLYKRHIPYIYLNGYEINSSNIEDTFCHRISPNKDMSWGEIVENLENYAINKEKPIILIIDGLNENPHPKEFCNNLGFFLHNLVTSNYIKVILTCRTQYYEEHFKELESVLGESLLIEKNINIDFNDSDKDRLINNYFNYFNVHVILNKDVKDQLCEDFLLLRIFSEANEGKNLGYVNHIKRDELFTNYYEMMKERVSTFLKQNNPESLYDFQIYDFIKEIIVFMVNNDLFFNVPLSQLTQKFTLNQMRVFSRFLDENILLRKDLEQKKGAFGKREVINFTYDAFRDYLISHYIIDEIKDDVEKQFRLIDKYTNDKHQLKEGLKPFLFVYSKNSENISIVNFLKTQKWYNEAFDKYIWEIDESLVAEEDIENVKRGLKDNSRNITFHLLYWERWNTNVHPILNTKILLSYLENLNDEELNEFFDKVFLKISYNRMNSYYKEYNKFEYEKYIENTSSLLDNSKILLQKDSELIFEVFAYFAAINGLKAQNIYREYIYKSKNITQLQKIVKVTKSSKVKSFINLML